MTIKESKSLRKLPKKVEAAYEALAEIRAKMKTLEEEKKELQEVIDSAFSEDEEAVRLSSGHLLTRKQIIVPEAQIVRKAYSFWKYTEVAPV